MTTRVKPPHPRPLSPENGGEGSHDLVTWASTHAAIARFSLSEKGLTALTGTT